jgi:hypothetical protein
MEYTEKIFKAAVADQLRADAKNGRGIEAYFENTVSFDEDKTLPLRVELMGDLPELSPNRQDDADNACALHAYLANLDETQASDKRVWSYLAHTTFRDYVSKRWPLPYSLEDMKISTDARRKVADAVLSHWFVNGNDSRALRRHALARLWWAAHLTVAPWERDTTFASLKSEDRYKYTRVLLSNEDLYSQVVERSLGSARRVLIALLEYFRKNPEKVNRLYLRGIMKEVNLISGIKRIQLLSYDEVYKLIESIGNDLQVADAK